MPDYNISEFADVNMREFALYTIEARALPNMIDGLKPSQRFYIYSSIKNPAGVFKKVSAVGGIVSDYGYNHAEGSIMGTGQLLAAEWYNNILLIEGEGSFGTRQVQQAGAPRYVKTRLHKNFHKYMKDIDLAPEHDDPEHAPPAFYVPVIPLVLCNGTRGIATGFATHILARDPADLVKACQEYLKTGKIQNDPKVKFPDFRGTTTFNAETGQYISRGLFTRNTKTKLTIDEIPYSFDRESYIKVLDTLEAKDEIVSYEDKCSGEFKFEVTLTNKSAKEWDDQTIINKFKLEKPYTENLNVIDEHGKLRQYDDVKKIIVDFCEYRLQNTLPARIANEKKKLEADKAKLEIKIAFIKWFLDSDYSFKGKNRQTITEEIGKAINYSAADVDVYIMPMNFYALTKEEITKLAGNLAETEKSLAFWKSTTPKDQFIEDLKHV